MKRIVILGSTVASFSAIQKIRETDKESAITLIAFNGDLPVKREDFFGFIDGGLTRNQVNCTNEKFYQDHQVDLILDKKFLRINFNRQRVFLEGKEKQTVEYDELIITDVPLNKFPEIKGTNKSGVLGFRKITDIEYVVEEISYVETIVIQSDCFLGLQVATALARRDKEVVVVLSGKGVLSRMLASENGDQIKSVFETNKIRFIENTFINELLGDSELKAVRLETGLVLSAQIVLFSQKELDFKMFSASGINLDGKLFVNENYETNLDHVYACGDLVRRKGVHLSNHPTDSFLEFQGGKIGASILGVECEVKQPLNKRTCVLSEYSFQLLGDVCSCGEVMVIEESLLDEMKYKCLFIRDNICQGAFLLNAASDATDIERLILEKELIESTQELNQNACDAVVFEESKIDESCSSEKNEDLIGSAQQDEEKNIGKS